MIAAGSVERISLRRVTPTLGFVDVRVPGVSLHDLKVEQRDDGSLVCTPPSRTDQRGRNWRSYDFAPGTREDIEAEVRRLWDQSA